MTDLIQTMYDAVVGMIGTDVDDRVHFVIMPPDAVFPCAVYSPIYSGDGIKASGGKGTYKGRFQIDLYADTVPTVMGLRHDLLLGLKQYSGSIVIDTRISGDVPYYQDDLDKWRIIIDFSVDSEWES